MEPVTIGAIILFAGTGIHVMNQGAREEYERQLTSAFTKLLADDSLHVLEMKRLPIPRTVRNLVALRMRENVNEMKGYATLIGKMGYTRTANAVHNAALKLEKK